MAIIMLHGFGPLKNGSLHPQLCARIKRAVRLYQQNPTESRVFYVAADEVGGRPAFESVKKALVSQGVPAKHIRVWAKAQNTAEEVRWFSKRLRPLQARGECWRARRYIAVTSWYHVPRTLTAYRRWFMPVTVSCSWSGARLRDVLLEPVKFVVMHVRS